MKEIKILKRMNTFVHFLEILVAIFILLLVIVGFIDLIQISPIGDFLFGNSVDFQNTFQEILSNILLLIVGIELALLLIKRNPANLIEIMFFVVARKLLIKTDTIWEIAIGILALAGIFAIRMYLVPKDQKIEI